MKTHIIIGASAAGYGAATILNRIDPKANIICITKEAEPYNKCLLVNYLAYSKDIRLSFASSMQLLANTEVTALKTQEKRIILASGEQLAYDTLLLAMGSRPKYHPYGNLVGFYNFYTFEDAQKIKEYIQIHSVTSAVVIGGGFTGLECADALAQVGIKVYVIEQKKSILPCILPYNDAQYLSHRMSKHTIVIIADDCVKEVYASGGKVTSLQLASGAILDISLIIYAGGSESSCTLAVQADIVVQKGVVTNKYMQTNIPSIHAAGDCALVWNRMERNLNISSSWPDALRQGMIAAYSMAGAAIRYEGFVRSYTSSLVGLPIMVYGGTSDKYETRVNGEHYYSFFLDDDERVVGFTSIGTFQKARELMKMIETQSPFRLIQELMV